MSLEIAVFCRNDKTGDIESVHYWEDVRDILADELGDFKVPRRIIGRKIDLAPIAEAAVERAVERLKERSSTIT